jgi:Asp/Glu/hydantoin racemase
VTPDQLSAIHERLDAAQISDYLRDRLRALLYEVERLTAEREILHELTDKAAAEQVQKAREGAFARGAEAMRRAVLKVSESRANLPVKDGVEAAWCRSAQCIVDDVRVLTVEDEP